MDSVGSEHGLDPLEEGESIAHDLDNVELLTVGVDIGSSTSHLLFSRLHLQRLAQSLSSRFVVVERAILHRSPVLLTPFKEGLIDVQALESFVDGAYQAAGVRPEAVDSGAVILTGVALERRNARAVAELFERYCGRFVTASAGHNLEAILAAHGSGVVRTSLDRPGELFLHLDVGGGTTKLALVEGGRILQTAAVAAGGRLFVLGRGRVPERVESAGRVYASRLGLDLAAPLDPVPVAEAMAAAVAAAARGEADPGLLLTEPLEPPRPPAVVTMSGGVSEYLDGDPGDFGDLSRQLAAALASAGLPGRLERPAERIRATVIGASQFTVELSGNTFLITDQSLLPLRNVPVVDARRGVAPGLRRLDVEEGAGPIALALHWEGPPRYAALRELAGEIAEAVPRTLAKGVPLVLALDADVGRSLGSILQEELAPGARLIALDGLDLEELDYIDVGELIRPAGVVPVVIKSLAF